jgi:hypothetical protein
MNGHVQMLPPTVNILGISAFYPAGIWSFLRVRLGSRVLHLHLVLALLLS